MLSSSLRHSLLLRTGVLPVLTTCFGPRTAAAGFSRMLGATYTSFLRIVSIYISACACGPKRLTVACVVFLQAAPAAGAGKRWS
jgi:hypothetical protein